MMLRGKRGGKFIDQVLELSSKFSEPWNSYSLKSMKKCLSPSSRAIYADGPRGRFGPAQSKPKFQAAQVTMPSPFGFGYYNYA